MSVAVMPENAIAELLGRLLETKANGSNRKLAAYLDVSNTALDRWVKGIAIPDPVYCWRIAERAGLPVEDVMRMAGHLPPLEDTPDEPEIIPEMRAALADMTAEEQRRFALRAIELAQTLIREARERDA